VERLLAYKPQTGHVSEKNFEVQKTKIFSDVFDEKLKKRLEVML
jgi:hypothetical protein